MTTVSGLVYNLFEESAIRSANVLVFRHSDSTLYSNNISDPDGIYFTEVPSSDEFITYFTVKDGYRGYSVTTSTSQLTVNLPMSLDSNIQSISGSSVYSYVSRFYTGTEFIDIKVSPTHLYVITTGGLDILDINGFKNVGFATRAGGFTSITLNKNFANRSSVLLGTYDSGVYELPLPESYDTLLDKDLTNTLQFKWGTSNNKLLSDRVTCLDQNVANNVVVGTNSGIDYIESSGIRYYSEYYTDIDTKCCRISEYNDLFYCPESSGLFVKYSPDSNWNVPDYKVVISGTGDYDFPLLSNYINDIDIKSVSGENSVFIASTSGLVYYDENRLDLDSTASGAVLISKYPIGV